MNSEVVSYKQNQEMQGLYVVFQYIDNFGGHYYVNGKKEYPYKEIAIFVGNIPEESRGLFTEIISEKLCSLLYKEIYFPPANENVDAYFIRLLKYDELDEHQRYDAAVNRSDRALIALVNNVKKNLAAFAAMQVEAESSFNNCEIIDLSDEMTPQFDDAALADMTSTTDGLLGIVDRVDAIAQNSTKQTELLEMIFENNKDVNKTNILQTNPEQAQGHANTGEKCIKIPVNRKKRTRITDKMLEKARKFVLDFPNAKYTDVCKHLGVSDNCTGFNKDKSPKKLRIVVDNARQANANGGMYLTGDKDIKDARDRYYSDSYKDEDDDE